LIAHQSITSLFGSSTFDLKKVFEVLEELHLLLEVLSVVFDMLLVRFKIFDDVLLLSQFGIEELGVTLEFVSQSFVGLVNEFGLIAYPLQEGVIDFCLNVVLMEFTLVLFVVIESLLHLLLSLLLSLFYVHHYSIVMLLFLPVHHLQFLHLLSQLSEILDLRRQLLLPILYFLLDSLHSHCNLLKSLVFIIV
jgi:hypothetical protein